METIINNFGWRRGFLTLLCLTMSLGAYAQKNVYPDVNAMHAVAFQAQRTDGMADAVFELVELDAALQGEIAVDAKGAVRAFKGNRIPAGEYTVKVQATPKDGKKTAVAEFKLTVRQNPNYFTYVRYGNNLGLEAETNPNMYVLTGGEKLSVAKPATDAKVPLKYAVTTVSQISRINIKASSGEITVTAPRSAQCGIAIVTATAGAGTENEFSVSTPVFFRYKDETDAIELDYAPFVLHVDPRTGGRSAAPAIKGAAKVYADYRRTFNYYPAAGKLAGGAPGVDGAFLTLLWTEYFASQGKAPNFGARKPMSYYDNRKDLGQALAYVDADDLAVVVNPGKWMAAGEYACGFVTGQMVVSSDQAEAKEGKGEQLFPIVIWFDTEIKQ